MRQPLTRIIAIDAHGVGFRGKTKRARRARLKAIAIMDEIGYPVDPDYVFAQVKTRPEVHTRWLAWRMMRNAGLSYPVIARDTGFKDHTSVIHGIKHLPKRLEEIAL